MKKLILIVAMIACMNVAKASQPVEQTSTLMMPPHIEFRDWGVYGILEYNFAMCMAWSYDPATLDPLASIGVNLQQPVFNGITGVVGFQLRRQSGIGVGFSYLYDGTGAFSQMPVFVELRSHYLRSRFTPFTAVQLGYSFPTGSFATYPSTLGNSYTFYLGQGGVMAGFSVGGRIAFKRNFGMSLNVGYMLLHSRRAGINDALYVEYNQESVLLHNLKAGLAFNF